MAVCFSRNKISRIEKDQSEPIAARLNCCNASKGGNCGCRERFVQGSAASPDLRKQNPLLSFIMQQKMEVPKGKSWVMMHGRRDVQDAMQDIRVKDKAEDARQALLEWRQVAAKDDTSLMEQRLTADRGVRCQQSRLITVV